MKHTPGPWAVCQHGPRQFTAWRYCKDSGGANAIERIKNDAGNTKRFRSQKAAEFAIAKAIS